MAERLIEGMFYALHGTTGIAFDPLNPPMYIDEKEIAGMEYHRFAIHAPGEGLVEIRVPKGNIVGSRIMPATRETVGLLRLVGDSPETTYHLFEDYKDKSADEVPEGSLEFLSRVCELAEHHASIGEHIEAQRKTPFGTRLDLLQ
jgi:hypothetical protein